MGDTSLQDLLYGRPLHLNNQWSDRILFHLPNLCITESDVLSCINPSWRIGSCVTDYNYQGYVNIFNSTKKWGDDFHFI